MPNPGMDEQTMREALRLVEKYGTVSAASRAENIPVETLRHRVNKAKAAGLHLSLEGGKFSVPHDHNVKGVSVLLDQEGNIKGQWVRTQADAVSDNWVDKFTDAMSDIPRAPEIKCPDDIDDDLAALYANSDWHVGADVSADEAGLEYNPKIAEERLRSGFSQCFSAIPAAKNAVILHNGDTTHANDDRDVTVKSGHRLKVKGSHDDNLRIVVRCIAWQIELALQKHEKVYFVARKGNHDPNTPTPLNLAMEARYENNPRVMVDASQSPFWRRRFGRVFLCSHHGHGVKPPQLAHTVKDMFRKEYGAADFHYMYTGHLHHEKVDTFGKLIWRQLPALGLMEQHGAEMGFVDTSGMYAAYFNTVTGKRSELTVQP